MKLLELVNEDEYPTMGGEVFDSSKMAEHYDGIW